MSMENEEQQRACKQPLCFCIVLLMSTPSAVLKVLGLPYSWQLHFPSANAQLLVYKQGCCPFPCVGSHQPCKNSPEEVGCLTTFQKDWFNSYQPCNVGLFMTWSPLFFKFCQLSESEMEYCCCLNCYASDS